MKIHAILATLLLHLGLPALAQPDEAGKLGSAAWGGVRFDHYPDIHCDEQGGAEHIKRCVGPPAQKIDGKKQQHDGSPQQ